MTARPSAEARPADGTPARGSPVGLARAFGGAIIFALPVLMTQEMWALGFAMEPVRLLLLMLLGVPLLVGLSHFIGYEDTLGLRDDLVDAFVAYAVGFLAVIPILLLLGIISWEMGVPEILGKVAIQAVPASIGALLAQAQFGGDAEDVRKEQRRETYAGEMFFMAVGALFLSFNIAPTEETMLLAHMMTAWHALALSATSLMLMHAFVYSVGFRGQGNVPEGVHWLSAFLRFTVVGYMICLLISAYVLWSFGRLDGTSLESAVMTVVVLGFPASIGAAAARLIL